MSTEPSNYELGRQAGMLEAQDARLKAIEEKVDILLDHMSQTKGGYRILLAVGGVAAAIGGAIAWLAELFIGRTPHT